MKICISSNQPDSPISIFLKLLRFLIRNGRLFWLRLRVKAIYGGFVKLGKNVAIGTRASVMSRREFILCDRVRIGSDFSCFVNLHVGPGTLISSSVAIVGNDHPFDTKEDVFHASRNNECLVVLEGDNLIGFGSIIIGPCKIGRGAIVGAGSVVSTDLLQDTVYVGVPARALRLRRRSNVVDAN